MAGNGVRRIKIPLTAITWQQVESALANHAALEATVDGTGSGTVPLVGDGWSIC